MQKIFKSSKICAFFLIKIFKFFITTKDISFQIKSYDDSRDDWNFCCIRKICKFERFVQFIDFFVEDHIFIVLILAGLRYGYQCYRLPLECNFVNSSLFTLKNFEHIWSLSHKITKLCGLWVLEWHCVPPSTESKLCSCGFW